MLTQMHTQTTTRRFYNLFAIMAKAAAGVAGLAASIGRTMNAPMPPTRHRMGSWEAGASFRARAVRDAAGEDR